MSEEKQMYFEQYKIKNVVDGIEGVKRVQLEIPDKDDIIIDVPEWELAVIMSEEPGLSVPGPIGSSTDSVNSRANVIADKIYELFKEYNVKIGDINFINRKLGDKIQGIQQKSINDRFGVDDQLDIRIKHWDE